MERYHLLRPIAPVAQLSEHRASNAEVAGGIPAGSTTIFSACSPTSRGVPLRTERLQVRLLPCGPIWNAYWTSEPGLGANECAPKRRVVQVHGIPHGLQALK